MCGRYSFAIKRGQLEAELGPMEIDGELEENYNIAPTQKAYVVTNDAPGRLQLFYWGLLPFWSKENRPDPRLINARMEGIEEKPSFRVPFRHRRCLVPADSFYEWEKKGKERFPYRIRMKRGKPMIMAGIWDIHGEGNSAVHSFSIITTPSNEELTSLHDRMPALLLDQQQRELWLSGEKDPAALRILLEPPPNGILDIYRVPVLVNNYRNNSPNLHEPIDKGVANNEI